jgi:flagellar motility protein MotE (MotC chaperone)
MRSFTRWLLLGVLVLDAVVVVGLFSGELTTLVAATLEAEPPAAAGPAAVAPVAEPGPSAESLRALARELATRKDDLDRRERELDELMRGAVVLEQAGVTPAAGPAPTVSSEPAPAPVKPAEAEATASRASAAFQSLQRAYENMEPDSAARALAGLAARDKAAVVQLLLGWKPRTSGAILDALTQIDAALAADLSYEIWKLDEGRASS